MIKGPKFDTYLYSIELIPYLQKYLEQCGNLKELLSESADQLLRRRGSPGFSFKQVFGEGNNDGLENLKQWLLKNSIGLKYGFLERNWDVAMPSTIKYFESIENPVLIAQILGTPKTIEKEIVSVDKMIWNKKLTRIPISIPEEDGISIGKRVISLGSRGGLPFGKRGTIIGINRYKKELMVLCDDELREGSNLDQRLTSARGYVAALRDFYYII